MKKIFSILAAIMFAGSMVAAEVIELTEANIAKVNGGQGYKSYTIKDDANREWKANAIINYHSNDTKDNKYIQIKKGDKNNGYFLQVPELPGKIATIEILVSSANTPITGGKNSANLFFSASNKTAEAGTGVASGTGAASVTIDAADLELTEGFITADAAVRIWSVKITLLEGEIAVKKPTFSPVETTFFDEVEVSLSCETEGSKIYYTLDGEDPTEASTLYEGSFKLTETTTVKAFAVKGEDKSGIVATTYTKVNVLSVVEALEATPAKGQYVLGFITAIEEVSTEHGNATFLMGDEEDAVLTIKAFRVRYLDNTAFTAANQIAVGDKVMIYGEIKSYQGENQLGQGSYIIKHEKAATAVENVEDGAKAVKMMENGQMVIIKNGVKYNALGVKME